MKNQKGIFMERFDIEKVTSDALAISEMDFQYEKMNEVTSTLSRRNRYYNMCALWEKFPVLQTLWEHIADAYRYTQKFIRKVVKKIKDIVSVVHDYFYVMRFYNSNNEHVFDKIGSSKNPIARLNQHLTNYGKKEGVAYGDIILQFDTHEIAASSMEDQVRDYFIRKYGKDNYLPKDRFFCEVDTKDLEGKLTDCYYALKAAVIQ